MRFPRLIFIIFSLFNSIIADAQIIDSDLENLKLSKNPVQLLDYCKSPSQKKYIDPFIVQNCTFSDCSYETLVRLKNSLSPNYGTYWMILDEIDIRELNMFRDTKLMDLQEWPQNGLSTQKQHLINSFLSQTVVPLLDSLSYSELYTLTKKNPSFYKTMVQRQLESRTKEKNEIVRSNIDDYIRWEKSTIHELQVSLKVIIWRYFFQRYQLVLDSYSQIGVVSDNPNVAASQFAKIVQASISSKELQSLLVNEVVEYVDQINKSRTLFAQNVGKDHPPMLTIKLPTVPTNYKVSNTDFSKIAKARQHFIESRESSSNVASVTGWFFPILTAIGKGISDLADIKTLANSEYEARLGYVEKVYVQMCKNIEKYIDSLGQSLSSSLDVSESEFLSQMN